MQDFEKEDGQVLLNYLNVKQFEDPSFFYVVQVNDKEQLKKYFGQSHDQ